LNVDSVRDNLTKPVSSIISQERTIRKDTQDDIRTTSILIPWCLLLEQPEKYRPGQAAWER
jgi:hypothetical protein